ncbi:MAG: hypothetical protein ABSE73_20355 [Planctomycetota bacterium]
MAKLSTQGIRELGLDIIRKKPGGIRYKELVAAIQAASPETPWDAIRWNVWDMQRKFPKDVAKPSRGLFMPVAAMGEGDNTPDSLVSTKAGKLKESDFYQPFAEWLKSDLDEATDALALGGSGLKGKWGTPDVVGVYKPLASNLIKFDLEILSGEVKIDPQQPVVAFGQAVGYRLFSAKTYIAMPNTITPDDQDRLEALCMLFGVGLALFELKPEDPQFSIRVRAQRFSPDMFYVNEFADRLRDHDSVAFERLFR